MVFCAFAAQPFNATAQTLQETLVSAYQTNPQLQADRARQRATDEDVSRAWGGLRPVVTFSGEKGRSQDKIAYPYPIDAAGNTKIGDFRSPDYEAIQMRQELWDGNRTFYDVQHSKYAVENGRYLLLSTEQGVLGDATQAYYDLYRDQQIFRIQKEYVQALEEERKGTKARYQVKDVTQTDVAQADARVARGIADLKTYEGNMEASKSAFLRAVGFEPSDNLPKPPPLPEAMPSNIDDALSEVENNPDLQASIFVEKAAGSDVDIVESQLLPDISLQAVSSRSHVPDTNRSTNMNNEILLSLTVPLYDGGVASAKTRAAKHTEGQRRLDVAVQRDRVIDQVKRSWRNLLATRARIVSLQETVKAAEIALVGVQQELRVGSRTVIDELNARQELLGTEIALFQSEHDEAISAYSVLSAVGRLTSESLRLPAEHYDPSAHYEDVRWLPWGPWIGTDYSDAGKTPPRRQSSPSPTER